MEHNFLLHRLVHNYWRFGSYWWNCTYGKMDFGGNKRFTRGNCNDYLVGIRFYLWNYRQYSIHSNYDSDVVRNSKTMGADYTLPLWWCLSLGACLGGNMTIIGAAANVIVSETSAHNGHPIPFMKFLKYGVLTMIISLVISSAYIYVRFLH